jgi:heavy metal sensor kinase
MRTTIRVRLTLWYTLVLTVLLGGACLATYLLMKQQVEAGLDDKLAQRLATVESVIINSQGDIYDVQHLGQNLPFQLYTDKVASYTTAAWSETELPTRLEELPALEGRLMKTSGGQFYRVQLRSVEKYGLTVASAVPADEAQGVLQRLLTIIALVIPAALVLSLAGGYFLAGRALAPVTEISRRARAITAESLSERIPVTNPRDEIGMLADIFNKTLARLEESFEQLRRFTADASHELRTPVAAMRTVGEVALHRRGDLESYREAIAGMLAETEHLTRLLDNLLTLARGEAGREQAAAEPLDVSSAVKETVDELRVLAEERNQTLTLSAAPGSVRIQRTLLRLALSNILHNAIKYTPRGGRVTIQAAPAGERELEITIEDSGPGIPLAERDRVFERFYRLDKARSRASGGAGLGLAIARWAVQSGGGTIAFVDPRGGSGCCCRITLTLADTP